jgi:hypothetical protein
MIRSYGGSWSLVAALFVGCVAPSDRGTSPSFDRGSKADDPGTKGAELVVSGQASIADLVSNGKGLFWLTDHAVMHRTMDGVVEQLASAVRPVNLVEHALELAWTERGQLVGWNPPELLGGGSVTTLFGDPAHPAFGPLVRVGNEFLYWINTDQQAILRLPISGDGRLVAGAAEIVVAGRPGLSHLAADATRLVWTEQTGSAAGRVMALDLRDGTPIEVYGSATAAPTAIVLDPPEFDSVVWASTDGHIQGTQIHGTGVCRGTEVPGSPWCDPPAIYGADERGVADLKYTSRGLYWSHSAPPNIAEVDFWPSCGGGDDVTILGPLTLFPWVLAPRGIAITPDSIWVADGLSGAIIKVPQPERAACEIQLGK